MLFKTILAPINGISVIIAIEFKKILNSNNNILIVLIIGQPKVNGNNPFFIDKFIYYKIDSNK